MENIKEEIQSIAYHYLDIVNFSNFCYEVHKKIEYEKKSCELKIFSDILKAFLDKHNKTEHNKKVFFHCSLPKFCLCVQFRVENGLRQRTCSRF